MKLRRILMTAILAASLLLLSACSLLAGGLFSRQSADANGLEYEIRNGILDHGVTITGIGSYEGTELIIPNEINGYTVDTIGEYAFENQTHLTSVTFPERMLYIKEGAFKGCTSLSGIVLPRQVYEVGSGVFENCPLVDSVVIESDYIGSGIFEGSCIKTVTFTAESISNRTMSGVDTVEHVILEEGVMHISSEAFTDCGFKSLSLPSTLEEVEYGAFMNCTELTELVIPDGLKKIEDQAFSNCSALEKLTVGKTVNTISKGVFSGCENLKEIYFNADSCSVSPEAFKGCDSVEKIIVPDLKSWCQNHFYADEENGIAPSVPFGENTVLVADGEIVTDLYLGAEDGITEIGRGVFYGYRPLKSIRLGAQISNVGDNAFAYCVNVTDIIIDDTEKTRLSDSAFEGYAQFDESDEEIFDAISASGGGFKNWTSLKHVKISDNATAVPVFEGCTSLETVYIPVSCYTISTNAFKNCTSLTKVELASGSRLSMIGGSAFEGCTALVEITLKASLTYVGAGAFKNCTALKRAFVPVEEIEEELFSGCVSLTEFEMSSKVKLVKKKAFANCTALEKVVLSESLTRIEAWAFENTPNLKQLHYNESSLEWIHVDLAEKWKEGASVEELVCTNNTVKLPE